MNTMERERKRGREKIGGAKVLRVTAREGLFKLGKKNLMMGSRTVGKRRGR